VHRYPDATYDNELNEQLGEFKNQLIEIPAEFFNVLYMVYVTKDTVSEVNSYYNLELQRLQWEKSLDLTSGNSSFNV
jgi:menaquinone-dependent protoporphyrinogen IX oxidase